MTIDRNETDSHFCPLVPDTIFETIGGPVPHIVNAALNVLLSLVAVTANLLVLLAMRRVTSLRLPSKLLLCSLVLTDLGASFITQPTFATFLFTKAATEATPISCLSFVLANLTGLVFCSASLLTIIAISLDRYIALFFHLKYQQIVTTRRVCAVLAFIWSFSLFFPSTVFWSVPLGKGLLITGVVIYLALISLLYVRICRRLRRQLVHSHVSQQAGNSLNVAKYRKTASAMMWVYVLSVICYLPFLCASSITAQRNTAVKQSIREFTCTLTLLNSSSNPFVYCMRLPDVRAEVIKKLRQFCCRSPQ